MESGHFRIRQSQPLITGQAGLVLVGQALTRFAQLSPSSQYAARRCQRAMSSKATRWGCRVTLSARDRCGLPGFILLIELGAIGKPMSKYPEERKAAVLAHWAAASTRGSSLAALPSPRPSAARQSYRDFDLNSQGATSLPSARAPSYIDGVAALQG